jgi:predicted nucleic acid-binding protein
VIRYLVDSSALWRILREAPVRDAWSDAVTAGAVGSCAVQRTEFRRSARSLDDYERMTEMFADLYPDVGMPTSLWRWMESSQHRLVRAGVHRGPSPTDLAIAGVAASRRLVVLHDDTDMATMGRHLDDVRERPVRHLPTVSS